MSNKLENARVLVIGAAGFIGGFVVSELLKEPVKEVIIYDINQLRYIPGIKGKLTIKDTSYLTFLQMQDILNYACRVKELNIVDNPFYCTVNNAVFTKDKKVLVYFQNNIKEVKN